MSKLILLKKEIANIFASHSADKCLSFCFVLHIILSQILYVGEEAKDKYMAVLTEWSNLMKSDALYAPINHRDRDLPPILVKIQHTMNIKFYLRVNEYCLQILKEYPVAPIVIVVCINSTTQEIIDIETKQNSEFPFVVQPPCPGWAKSFHLFNGSSIHAYLNAQPLHPLVIVAHFLIEQKQSLIAMEHRQDPTIHQLFALAKDIFGTDIHEYEDFLVVLQ